MVAVALSCCLPTSNLQMSFVQMHFIHLVINVLAVASSLPSSFLSLPLLFCHPSAIRPCHTNVGSFENISFSQCFDLGSRLSWHYRLHLRSQRSRSGITVCLGQQVADPLSSYLILVVILQQKQTDMSRKLLPLLSFVMEVP